MPDQGRTFRALPDDPATAFAGLPTPCYLISEQALLENAQILSEVAKASGCRMLLAQKAFSNFNCYPIFRDHLAGTEASGLYEARLGFEEMPGKEVHVFSAAYREEEFDELLSYADHILFNSAGQLARFGRAAKDAGKQVGLRINPECSTQKTTPLYDPCAEGSRLGVTRAVFDAEMTPDRIALLDGLHIHTLCEQDADDLITTWEAFEDRFRDLLPRMSFLNLGGGHHITRSDYDREALIDLILRIRSLYGVEVYLEPGEAWALDAGYLLTRIEDIVQNGSTTIAILDASAACHAPDVIEMPYQPPLFEAFPVGKEASDMTGTILQLAGPTCLAGDRFGDYCFQKKKQIGDLLLFGDMAIYTSCKNNTFNGIPLPAIRLLAPDGSVKTLAEFSYSDFRSRLGS